MEVSSSISLSQDAPGHKEITGCMMTALPCCCSCADRRPQAAAYPVYVDGKGIRMQGKRWQRYCRRCHDYWQSLASDTDTLEPIQTSPASGPTTSVRAEMSLPHMRFDNRHRRLSESIGDEHLRTNVVMSTSTTTSTAISQSQHQDSNTNNPQIATNAVREQVYPLGSREDVQQDDYESPLAGMFGRAYGRYREAEAARQEAQAHGFEAISSWSNQGQFTTVYRPSPNPLFDPAGVYQQTQEGQARTQDNINLRLGQLQYYRDLASQSTSAGLENLSRGTEGGFGPGTSSTQTSLDPRATRFVPESLPMSPAMRSNLRRQRFGFHRQFYTDSVEMFGRRALDNPFENNLRENDPFEHDDNAVNPIDAQSSRPSPIKSEDLKVDLACKICTEQKINTVCLPCMHACMCRWCAAIHKNDCRDYDTGRWSGVLWKCPICRKTIHEVKRLYI